MQRTTSPEITSPAFSPLSPSKEDDQQQDSYDDVDYVPDADEGSSSSDSVLQQSNLDDFAIFEVFEGYRNLSLFLPEPEEEKGKNRFYRTKKEENYKD